MATALITHPSCLDHVPPEGHPECPGRLTAVLSKLDETEFGALLRTSAHRAGRDQITCMHDADYIAALFAEIPLSGIRQLDSDTFVSPGSGEAILHAAGAAIVAVDMVMKTKVRNGFCAVRPPGHHALRDRAMGFCAVNNVAVAAAHARAAHGLRRIAVVDFDVHHGNGTQAMFETDVDLLYASTHQSPLYPGTGRVSETGIAGNIVNCPLPPGAGSAAFRQAFVETLLPALARFRPEFIIISAGFDAHRDDPLAALRLDEEDFGWATAEICSTSARLCDGRVVSVLEGGYDLDALARSAAAHVRALMQA